jgi:hypothetical protein
MKLHTAVTVPINPPSASPVLTQAQVWKGLDEKARRPMGFVPITECTITEDRGATGFTRKVKFAEGAPLSGVYHEEITYYPEMKVRCSPNAL